MEVGMMSKDQRARYQTATFKAHYYLWSAIRGHVLSGGDPITGKPPQKRFHDPLAREEGRAAHKALCRFWLDRAAAIREES